MGARQELRQAMAAGYRRAKKKGRGQTLDEFCGLTGYNRCNAGLLLRNLVELAYEKLKCISASTIDRLLRPEKARMRLKGRSHTKPAVLLQYQVPIRTWAELG